MASARRSLTKAPQEGARQPGTLAQEWRSLTRAATFVAILTSPAFFFVLYSRGGWSFLAALAGTAAAVVIFRGLVDVIPRRLIPSPSLYEADDAARKEDAIARRR